MTNSLYVEYLKPATGEEIFTLGGTRWQFCWCKYPTGKIDLGVYSFAGDLCYSYEHFRYAFNLN